jgi:hypothetical protein
VTAPGDRKRLRPWELWITDEMRERLHNAVALTLRHGGPRSAPEFARKAIEDAIERTEQELNNGEPAPPAPPPKAGRPKGAPDLAPRRPYAKRREAPPPE